MVHALNWPRQNSADGLVRAAMGTSAGNNSGNSVVVEAEEIHADKTGDPFARLVFRFHRAGSQSGFITNDPITACYEAEFGFYGVIGSVHRTSCPEGAKEIASLRSSTAQDCLLGARVAGKAIVWRPTRIQLQPGELTCDPQTALQLDGVKAPH